MRDLSVLVHEIPVAVMFNDKIARVKPVVENLRAKDVPSDTPAYLVSAVYQVLMAELLSIVVVHFECRMGYSCLKSRFRWFDKEAVVI